jgi:hypothetical protein
MSPRQKHVLLYIAFVGLPLLALVGILQAGRGMVAPVSIGGRWKVDSGGKLASAIKCSPTQEADPVVLRIGQSGQHLRMELRDGENTMFRGKLEGTTMTAEAPAGIAQPPAIQVHADLDRGAQPAVLVGTVDVSKCPGQIPFRAVRQETTTGGTL